MEFCCGGGSEELGLVSAAWGQKNISGVINGRCGRGLAWHKLRLDLFLICFVKLDQAFRTMKVWASAAILSLHTLNF